MSRVKQLQDLGLSECEAQVYVATLEVGVGTAFKIADVAKLARSTTHDLLLALANKGLVSSFMRGSKKYYEASDPSVLEDLVTKQEETLRRLLPSLKASYNTKARKPRVRYYEGTKGIGIAFKEFLAEADNLLTFAPSMSEIRDKLPEYFPKVMRERIKRGIHSRAILIDTGESYEEDDVRDLRRTKLIDKKYYSSPAVWIWKDKIMFANTKGELITVIIEDREIANFIKMLLEYIWDHE